jgi:hypothetical protein
VKTSTRTTIHKSCTILGRRELLRSSAKIVNNEKPNSSDNTCLKFYFLINAINDSDNEKRPHILSLFSELCSKRGKNIIKIIVLSRPIIRIEKYLKDKTVYHIKLQRENQLDIEKIVDVRLESV